MKLTPPLLADASSLIELYGDIVTYRSQQGDTVDIPALIGALRGEPITLDDGKYWRKSNQITIRAIDVESIDPMDTIEDNLGEIWKITGSHSDQTTGTHTLDIQTDQLITRFRRTQ